MSSDAAAFALPRDILEQALERALAPYLEPARIDTMLAAHLDRRVGMVTLDEAASRCGWTPIAFHRLLRKHGVRVVRLSRKKPPLLRTADLERLIIDLSRPLGRVRRRKSTQATT